MPIRSSRGRVAAYRSLWQWPLRSPARLGLTVLFVLAVAVGVSAALAAVAGPAPIPTAAGVSSGAPTSGAPSSGDQPSRTRSEPSTPRTPAATALPPVTELAPSTVPVADASPEALTVATRWSAAWLRPSEGTTAEEWLAGLQPFTTEEYLGLLATVDPGNIPATSVTGEPRAVRAAPSSVDVEVPTDALTLLVLVVRTPDGDWRVSGYDEA